MKATRLSKTQLLNLIKEEVSKVKTKRRLSEATELFPDTLTFVLDMKSFEEADRGGYGEDWFTGVVEYTCKERPELGLMFGAHGSKGFGLEEIDDYPDAVRVEQKVFGLSRRNQ